MMFKKTFFIFLLSIIFLNISLIYATNVNNKNDNFLRIHVVANSDSIDDQLIKCIVAKNVNEYITTITQNCNSKQACKQAIEQNMQNILSLCNKTINENKLSYSVKAYVGKIAYDEKYMNNFRMEAGTYDSLKIVIGNGKGNNWWSLIYPTSFTSLTQDEMLNEDTEYSFGIVEMLKNIFNF